LISGIFVNISKISKTQDFRNRITIKNNETDYKILNVCEIKIMNVIGTIRFI